MTASLPTMNPLQPAIDEMLHAMRVGGDALLAAGSKSTLPAIPSYARLDADDDAVSAAQLEALRAETSANDQ